MNIARLTIFTLFVLIFTLSPVAQAQHKFGHVNVSELLDMMPEKAEATAALEKFVKGLEAQLTAMDAEYQKKLTDYQTNYESYSDLVDKTKRQEISDLQTRMTEFRGEAQEQVEQKEAELLAPILEKLQKTIEEVAAENGYDYVIDNGAGILLVTPELDNLVPMVKTKLGI